MFLTFITVILSLKFSLSETQINSIVVILKELHPGQNWKYLFFFYPKTCLLVYSHYKCFMGKSLSVQKRITIYFVIPRPRVNIYKVGRWNV